MRDDAFWTLVELLAAVVWFRGFMGPGHSLLVSAFAGVMVALCLWFAGVNACRLWLGFWGRR